MNTAPRPSLSTCLRAGLLCAGLLLGHAADAARGPAPTAFQTRTYAAGLEPVSYTHLTLPTKA